MTLRELLSFIDGQGIPLCQGGALDPMPSGASGVAGEVVALLLADQPVDALIDRAEAIGRLGSIRRRYMADDAPVEGFRLVERVVLEIDKAFNEEALRQR